MLEHSSVTERIINICVGLLTHHSKLNGWCNGVQLQDDVLLQFWSLLVSPDYILNIWSSYPGISHKEIPLYLALEISKDGVEHFPQVQQHSDRRIHQSKRRRLQMLKNLWLKSVLLSLFRDLAIFLPLNLPTSMQLML